MCEDSGSATTCVSNVDNIPEPSSSQHLRTFRHYDPSGKDSEGQNDACK